MKHIKKLLIACSLLLAASTHAEQITVAARAVMTKYGFVLPGEVAEK